MLQRGNYQIGPPDWNPGTRRILILSVVCSAIGQVLPPDIQHLVAVPHLSAPWTLATAAVFSPGMMPFILTAIMLWMFGNTVESYLGERRFYILFFGVSAVANLATLLFYGLVHGYWQAAIAGGSTWGIEALFLAWAHYNRNANVLLMFLLPINAWLLAQGSLAIGVLGLLTGSPLAPGAVAAWFAAIGYVSHGRALHLRWVDDAAQRAKAAYDGWRLKRKASHLRVVQGKKHGGDPWQRDDDEKPIVH